MNQEVDKIEIKKIIEELFKTEVGNDHDNLFKQGVINSFEAVELLTKLENHFNIRISVLSFAEEDSFSVNNIATIISEALKTTTRK